MNDAPDVEVEADHRSAALESFRELLGRMDVDLIDRDEENDHPAQPT